MLRITAAAAAAAAGTPKSELEDFAGAKFYCLHALAYDY